MPPPNPFQDEYKFYYAGLPSTPILVARTGTTPWEEPPGMEAYRKAKELRAAGEHAIEKVWEGNLAFKIHSLLDSAKVEWTSTDVVRIGKVGEPFAPIILWIGVEPNTLPHPDGIVVALECQKILEGYNIFDIEVEIRESVVTRSASLKFLAPAYLLDPTSDIREPLTTTLGLPISTQSTPWFEGTGGFFITAGKSVKKLFLVTARHVVFPLGEYGNNHFEHMDGDHNRHNVTLFGTVIFQKYLEAIQEEIGGERSAIKIRETRLAFIKKANSTAHEEELQVIQASLDQAHRTITKLDALYQQVSTDWATLESRVLGHVVLSPPISVNAGNEGYTEDWALIEIDTNVDLTNFTGNAIDLGTRIPVKEFVRRMSPNPQQDSNPLEYPANRLLQLKGTIPDEEMRHATPKLAVIKRGCATGLTFGLSNNIRSYTRSCQRVLTGVSKEWAILSSDRKSDKPFSEVGDSGSVIADGLGRIGGLLTGGNGFSLASLDMTYATPISFLLERIQSNGVCEPDINLGPTTGS